MAMALKKEKEERKGDSVNPVRHDICATAFSYKSLIFLRIALALGLAFAHI